MGANHLPAEYGAQHRRVALEPKWLLERSRKQKRLFHRQSRTCRHTACFLRLSTSASWKHAQRRRLARLFASDRRRLRSYWKSNPYLAARFTTESDSLHPQWIV